MDYRKRGRGDPRRPDPPFLQLLERALRAYGAWLLLRDGRAAPLGGEAAAARAEDAALGIFHGRPALNVNVILEVGAGLPGASAAEVARTVLGTEDVASLPPNRPRRYPVVAVKLPFLAARLRRRMSRLGSEVCETWEAARREPMSTERARELLPVARRQFTWSLLNHSHATFLSQAAYEQLEKLVSAAGRADSMSQLLSGFGGMLEVTMLQRLWLVAHSREDLDDFLSTYGFLGPGAGNLASRPWREDPGPLHRACETYRAVPEEQAPTAIEVRRRTVRERAEAELLGALPRHRRPGARVLLRLARHFIPLREVGKSMYLQAGDSARIAFRALGADLAERELIANPEDVFFLTYDELVGELPSDPGEAVELTPHPLPRSPRRHDPVAVHRHSRAERPAPGARCHLGARGHRGVRRSGGGNGSRRIGSRRRDRAARRGRDPGRGGHRPELDDALPRGERRRDRRRGNARARRDRCSRARYPVRHQRGQCNRVHPERRPDSRRRRLR